MSADRNPWSVQSVSDSGVGLVSLEKFNKQIIRNSKKNSRNTIDKINIYRLMRGRDRHF